MNKGTEPAHKLLELLIMKALISGKTKGSTVRLYVPDLAAEMDQVAGSKVDLVITIDLAWDEPVNILDDLLASEEEIEDGQQ